MLKRFTRRGSGLLSLAAFAAVSLFAQSERGTISGTVKDATGAVVPGAAITVTNTATNVTVNLTSNQDGDYTIPSVAVGSYSVRVEKPGFRPAVLNQLTVDAATNVRADVTLQVGTSSQAIEVQASVAQLHTEDAKTSVTIENKLVDDLPLVVNGTVRTPFDLAVLTPEAKNLGGDAGFTLGGGQAAGYQTTLDGISADTSRALQKSWVASNSPSVEAITEFTVDTNGFKAEYGHAAGGVMQFVTKSGTNAFHGSAYEFIRNTDFDANDWFSNRAGKARQIYKQNDFGATVGGPVFIPKIYNGKDKTFFFFSYEGFRNRNGATNATDTIPTPEMYNGDFSKWVTASGQMIPIYDPTTQVTGANGTVTRTPFPNNQIPKSLFNPTSIQALSVFQSSGTLVPNNGAAPGTVGYINNNYLITNGSNVQPVNKYSIKGDHIFNEKHRISGYYGVDHEAMVPGPEGPATLPGLYSNYNDLHQNSHVLRFSWDWTFSPNKLNHFYAGGNDWIQDHKPPQEYIGNWKSKFCLGNVPDCNDNLVNLFTTGSANYYSQWGGNADNGSENTVYGYNDDFTWIKGAHTIKFGGQYQLTHYNGFGRQCISGCVGFSYAETGLPGVLDPNQGGNSFASFLLGYADNGQIDTIRFIGQQYYYFAGFVQDDWRVNSKLNLNLGLRWETDLPPTGVNDSWSDFSPTTPNPGAGGILGAVLFAGSGPGRVGSRTLADGWYKGFGPHFGFAYSLNDKTVIRGGYALSYAEVQTVTGSTHNMGFTLTQTFPNQSNGINPTYLISQGIPPWTAPPFINPSVSNGSSVSWFQGQEVSRLPESHNINLAIQRQLTSSMVLEGSYNGVIGEHLQTQVLDYNQDNPSVLTRFGNIVQSTAVLNSQIGSATANAAGVFAPYPGFTGTVKQALRPYPQYTLVDTYAGGGDHSGHSAYHAGIIQLTKRYSRGLSLQTSYVFSKIITNADSFWGNNTSTGGGGCCLAADQYNRGLEKAIGQFNQTHNFKVGLVYDLPFGRGHSYLTKGPGAWVLGNWRTSGVLTYGSGQPYSLTSSYVLPLYGATNGRSTPYVTSFNGWQPNWNGKFDPTIDSFVVPFCGTTPGCTGPFPNQGLNTPLNGFGNMPRYNPVLTQFPNYNENISLTRSFPIKEQLRLEFRAEAFNIFNRVRFGTGDANLQDQNFGKLTSSSDLLNTPRQLQFALKFYF
ncbi:MAG TPA: TonB-dependent receptor [Bryobacteraceae bacterium]|nr:TonB-dependent receptor [Bryobacteraceae bacterium]